MKTPIIFLSIVAVLPAAASAASHSLEVKFRNGAKNWTQTVRVNDGSQANFVGPIPGDGARKGIINVLASPDARSGAFNLEYQVELSAGSGTSRAETFQAQGSISMNAGARVVAVECGAYSIELGLDAAAGAAGAWDAAGAGNVRFTLDTANGNSKRRCRQVYRPDSQGNVVEGVTSTGRKTGFIMNTMASRNPADGSFVVQYQVEDSPGTKPIQMQNEQTLIPGKWKVELGKGYKLDFLVEASAAASAAKAAPAAAPAAKPADSMSVPLLR